MTGIFDDNPFMKAVERVAERLEEANREAEKSRATPFGKQRATGKELRAAVRANPDMLVKLLADEKQADAVRRLLLGGGRERD